MVGAASKTPGPEAERQWRRIERKPWHFATHWIENVSDSTLLDSNALAQLGTAAARRNRGNPSIRFGSRSVRRLLASNLAIARRRLAYGWPR